MPSSQTSASFNLHLSISPSQACATICHLLVNWPTDPPTYPRHPTSTTCPLSRQVTGCHPLPTSFRSHSVPHATCTPTAPAHPLTRTNNPLFHPRVSPRRRISKDRKPLAHASTNLPRKQFRRYLVAVKTFYPASSTTAVTSRPRHHHLCRVRTPPMPIRPMPICTAVAVAEGGDETNTSGIWARLH